MGYQITLRNGTEIQCVYRTVRLHKAIKEDVEATAPEGTGDREEGVAIALATVEALSNLRIDDLPAPDRIEALWQAFEQIIEHDPPITDKSARAARKAGRDMANTFEFGWRRRYNLAPTDERYLDATHTQIMTDLWAHHYADQKDKGESEEMIEDEDFNLDAIKAAAEAGEDFEDMSETWSKN